MRRAILYLAAIAALACLSTSPVSAQNPENPQYEGQLLDLQLRPLMLEQGDPEAPLTIDQQIFIARTRENYPDFYKWLRRQPGFRKPIVDMTEADFLRFRGAFAKWFDARGAFPYGSQQAMENEAFAIYFWNLMRDSGGEGD